MARDCHLLDKKLLSMTDVDLIFARIVPVGERKIRFDQFKQVRPARHTACRRRRRRLGTIPLRFFGTTGIHSFASLRRSQLPPRRRLQGLALIAEKRRTDVAAVVDAVLATGGPVTVGTRFTKSAVPHAHPLLGALLGAQHALAPQPRAPVPKSGAARRRLRRSLSHRRTARGVAEAWRRRGGGVAEAWRRRGGGTEGRHAREGV
jgi:hypothetical protein